MHALHVRRVTIDRLGLVNASSADADGGGAVGGRGARIGRCINVGRACVIRSATTALLDARQCGRRGWLVDCRGYTP